MEQATLLCHLETNGRNKAVLAATSDLATMLNAAVIGIAACQPIQPFGEVPYSGEILEADIAEIQRETQAVEQEMRSRLGGMVQRLSFRSAATYQELADYIAGESRAADFIVTAPDIGGLMLGETRRTSIGDLVMDAGRPVIIVPPDAVECRLGHVVVAWKDSRASRRAVSDALPLLRHAARVTVAEVTREADLENAVRRTDDVVAWLQVHGVQAGSIARISDGTDAESLHRLLDEENCDFAVAGAYGRSRVGEWIFGGVTTDLLLSPDRCTLVSH